MIKKRLCYTVIVSTVLFQELFFFEALRNDKLVISNTSKLLHERVILR